MIWLTWRQFRAQAIVAAVLLGVVLIALAATGTHLWSLYDSTGLAACHSGCASAAANFLSEARVSSGLTEYYTAVFLMYAAPTLIGIFWGAPLIARELETGTYRLAWNQSVSRTRWTLAKLGLLALCAMGTVGLLSLMTGLWGKPYMVAMAHATEGGALSSAGRLTPVIFGATGIAPIGYAAFGFALGAAAGLVIRRTVPAMAVTLAVFAAIQLAWPIWIRAHLLPPVTKTLPLFMNGHANMNSLGETAIINGRTVVSGTYRPAGAWVLADSTITPSGHVFTGPATSACNGGVYTTGQSCANWLANLHLRQLVIYQPATRFWPLQWEEAGLYLLLALLVAGLSAWWIKRQSA